MAIPDLCTYCILPNRQTDHGARSVVHAIITTAMILTSAASPGPEKDAVSSVVKAIRDGADLEIAFPGAIAAEEIAALQRVSACAPTHPWKLKNGDYAVVWKCSADRALAMIVTLRDDKVRSVSTTQVVRRTTFQRR